MFSSNKFFGRKEFIDEILSLLEHGQPCSIVAERRVGKTSLLLYISHKSFRKALESIMGNILVVYLDFQGHQDLTIETFWRVLIREAETQARLQNLPGAISELLKGLINTDGIDIAHIKEFINACEEYGYRILLLFDEFEYVADCNSLDLAFFGGLRSLIASNLPVLCVTASRKTLSEIDKFALGSSFVSSPFFNVFTTLRLGAFEKSDVEWMISVLLSNNYIKFHQDDQDFIYDISGYHPFFMQMACYYLYEEKTKGRNRTGKEIRLSARTRFNKQCRDHFEFYWRNSNDSEKAVMSAYAFSHPIIPKNSSDSQRVQLDIAIQTLIDRVLLIPNNNGTYRLISSSFASWIRESSSTEIVPSTTWKLEPGDFKRLPKDGAKFEMLVSRLLEAIGYHVLEKSVVNGKKDADLLAERIINDKEIIRHELILVNCKHYAHSGKAVGSKDVGDWQRSMHSYNAVGYLLVTDTRVPETLRRQFREFGNDLSKPGWADIWDADKIINYLNEYPKIREIFFPSNPIDQTIAENLALRDDETPSKKTSHIRSKNFNSSEMKLLDFINDSHLLHSIAVIKEAATDIWSDSAPRIIRNFTNHGITHSERLTNIAFGLLRANQGISLSSQESFLLLASIYLHDIGMQCDLVKFRKIKEIAEILGAKFNIEFNAETSNGFKIEEQWAIYENHQYITAAWIEYAYQTKRTSLGRIVDTIPEDLVDDLIDICKYHTKLPIYECPITLKFDPTGRKQFIAAILRFSDELDIEGQRAPIDVIKNFKFNQRASLYWFLNNRARIVIDARNIITLTISLHPDDAKEYGCLIQDAFINEFHTRNLPAMTVLAQNNNPVIISSSSKVIENEYDDRLPPEIIRALQLIMNRSPSFDLADEVRNWLLAIGYEVSEPQQSDSRIIDMEAILEKGTLMQKMLVRCIDGSITASDVHALNIKLNRNVPMGWIISDKRVSAQARDLSSRLNDIKVSNLSDFIRNIWISYIEILQSLVERDRIPDLYIDLGCYKQEVDDNGLELFRDKYSSLDEYVDRWQKERGSMHISLLGAAGMGKTWFCRHYAYRQLLRYLEDPANERLPLLINLRSFSKSLTPQQLINEVLIEHYRLPFIGSAFKVFQEMNRRGKLILLLDGFDEMSQKADNQTIVENFWQLASLVEERSKVILTCRAEFFRWAKDSEMIFEGDKNSQKILLSPPTFEVLYIDSLNNERISKLINLRFGLEKGIKIADRIFMKPDLNEMARNPIMIEFLYAAMEEANDNMLRNSAQTYLHATNKLLLRNMNTARTFTSTADKLYFLCELAWEMIKRNELRIHYERINELIQDYFGNEIMARRDLDNLDYDLRSQTLLHRDAAGYYEFQHRSLAEYFVALKFAIELGCLDQEFATTYVEANYKSSKLPYEQKSLSELSKTFGTISLWEARYRNIKQLLEEMISKNGKKRLNTIHNELKTNEELKYSKETNNVYKNLNILINDLGQ